MKLNRNSLCVLLLLFFMVTVMSSCWYQSGKLSSTKLELGEMKVYSEKQMEKHRRQSVRLNNRILRENKRLKAKRRR